MKKYTLIFFAICLIAILNAVDVTIGTATTTNTSTESPCPYGNRYRNERVQYIFTADELHQAGGGAGPINSITLQVDSLYGCGPLSNYRVRIGQTTSYGWSYESRDFINCPNLVWSSASYQPVTGTNIHYFNPAYIWDGTSNLVVDMGYSLTSYFAPKTANPGVYYTYTGDYKTIYTISDAMDALTQTQAYQVSCNRANITFNMGAVAPTIPNTAIIGTPANGATQLALNSTLNWSSGGGNPTGYKLFFGTSSPPSFNADLGNVTTWTPIPALDYSTTYYWQVVPYNSYGDATGCPVWSFTTRANPMVSSFPWTVSYGTTYPAPFPPEDWTKHSGVLSDSTALGDNGTGYWFLRNWRNQPSSLNNKAAGIALEHSYKGWLITPPIAIPSDSYQLVFSAALMASYTGNPPNLNGVDDFFAVLVGDGTSWTEANIIRKWDNAGSPYVLNSISNLGETFILPLGAAGTKYIAFYAGSVYSNASNQLMLDYVTVRVNPELPILSYHPQSLNLDLAIQNVPTAYQNVTITNSGQGFMVINPPDISFVGSGAGMFSIDSTVLPMVLSAGQSAILPVRFTPTAEGAITDTLRITNNQSRAFYDIRLSGIGLPQQTIAVGNGTIAVEASPIDANRGYSYSQTILLQSEIQVPNKQIEHLWYYWNSDYEGSCSNDWTIYMGHTTKVAFDTETDWVPLTNLTQVFHGNVYLPSHPCWIEIVLDTPFLYNNASNLVIAVDENEPLYQGYSCFFIGTAVISNRCLTHASSGINAEPQAPPPGNLSMSIPNLMLHFAPATATPILSVTPDSLSFNGCMVNTNSQLKLVTITNTGGGTLWFDSQNVTITGDHASQFTFYGDGISALLNGQSATILVRFIPTSTGFKTANLIFPNGSDSISLPMSGYGFASNSFYEDFEGTIFPPQGWTVADTMWVQSTICTHIPEVILDGSASALSYLDRDVPESMLITPALLKGSGEQYLNFLLKGFNNTYGYGSCTLQVEYSQLNSNVWTPIGDLISFWNGEQLRYQSIDISALPEDVYYFAFAVNSSFSYYADGIRYYASVIIDDVWCSGTLPQPFLNVDASQLTFDDTGNPAQNLQLSTYFAWTAQSSSDWLHLSSNSGTGAYTFVVSADSNPGLPSRTATITISNLYNPPVSVTVTQSGTRGNALSFDGTDDYVQCPDNDNNISNVFSLAVWVKWDTNNAANIQFLCAKDYEQMEIHTGGGANNLRFIPTNGVYLDAFNVLPVNIWTHIACTYDSNLGQAHMYINGNEVTLINNGYNPLTTPVANTGEAFYMGRRGDYGYRFQGTLDELSVWSKALTLDEVRSLMYAPVDAVIATNLVGYYTFNVGTPGGDNTGLTIMPNLAALASPGTLNSFALNGNSSNWVLSEAMLPGSLLTPVLTIGSGGVLSWQAVVNADSYNIYRSATPGGTFDLVGTTTATTWQETEAGISQAFYRITAKATL